MVHGLGLRASAAWGTGSFLVRELRSCMSLAWPKKRRKRWRIHYHKLRLQYPFIGNEQIQQAENQYWQSWTQQIINQLDITDNYKLLHPTSVEYTHSAQAPSGTFTKINHITDYKTYLNKFKRTEIRPINLEIITGR